MLTKPRANAASSVKGEKMRRFALAAASIAAMTFFLIVPASAQSRIALVIANSAYQGVPPLATTAADAGLVAATLQAAGYDVTQYENLTGQTIGAVFGPFIDKIKAAGPNAVVFVYFSAGGSATAVSVCCWLAKASGSTTRSSIGFTRKSG